MIKGATRSMLDRPPRLMVAQMDPYAVQPDRPLRTRLSVLPVALTVALASRTIAENRKLFRGVCSE
ncbi:hypothetical protein D3C83_147840 [compost metagenome]